MKHRGKYDDSAPWRLVINAVHIAHHRKWLLPGEVDVVATAIGDVLDGLCDGQTHFAHHPICHTLRYHKEVELDFGKLRLMIFEKPGQLLVLHPFLTLSSPRAH